MNYLKQLAITAVLFIISSPVFAEEAAAGANTDSSFLGLIGIGAGLGIGLAVTGAASGQGKAAAAALDGIARNPSSAGKMLVPLILSLALMESLVILAFLVTGGLGDTIKAALGL